MTLRISTCLCLVLLAACERQEPARSAEAGPSFEPATPAAEHSSATSGSSTELTPASGSLGEPGPAAPAAPNALGVPAAPPAAAAGPVGSESPAAEPTRTPDVVYVPTPQPVVDRMLQLAKVKKGDVVYDLGCGDGRIVITAAKRFGVRAYGFDIDPERVAEAKSNVKAAQLEDLVTIEQRDIFTLDLSPASVVTLYLLPKLNVRLIPQLERLAPGSRVVSHDFAMEGIKPVQHVTMRLPGEAENHAVYLWKLPFVRE